MEAQLGLIEKTETNEKVSSKRSKIRKITKTSFQPGKKYHPEGINREN